ncbi:sensor histidine kinase [Humisphaera borealis]|uniref:histidine kinase n=1 Tax=Humisphaera borealis TaxID=2807512 RepID=A0A7M2WQ55_9BACT|nr:ATP-binding protein [Humisphaera borealis]QOV87382.1 PAS domain-containing protein [Humisphaera borealis]
MTSVLFRYLFAVGVVLAAGGIRWWLGQTYGVLPPFLTFYPAVLLVASVAGGEPGILATLASTLLADYLFIPPCGSISVTSTSDFLSLSIFAGCNLCLCVLGDRLRQTRQVEAVAQQTELQKRAEAELLQTNDRLRLFAAHAPAAIAMLDDRMRYVAVSQRWLSDYGMRGKDVIGQCHYEMFPEIPERWKMIHRRCLAGAVERAEEDPFVRADGNTQWLRWEVRPWNIAAAKAGGIIVFSEDITERKRAEAEILELNEHLRSKVAELEALFAVIPIGVAVAEDAECRTIRANAVLSKMLGTPVTANVSKSAPLDQRPGYRAMRDGAELAPDDLPLQVAARTGHQVENFEIDVVPVDGPAVPIAANARPLLDSLGKPRGAVGVFWDMTELKQAESLRVAKEAAEIANRAKDDFLAAVTHDLRTPISAIRLHAEILRRLNSSPELRDSIGWIEQSAKDQSRLIDDILDTTRILHGKLRIELLRVDLVPVVRAAMTTVAPFAGERGVQLVLDQPEDFPLFVEGDSLRLQQICWNLLTNAVKFSPRGSLVRIRPGRESTHISIQVIDQGKGIEPDFLPHVFDRMSQTGDHHSRRLGLGLGLYIVRELVQLHGGSVRAESEGAGRGATFYVQLPLHRTT